jgi:hypothetical protein
MSKSELLLLLLIAPIIFFGLFLLTHRADAIELHRFYSQENKSHFYTTSEGEKQATLGNDEWRYEGIAYQVNNENDNIPVYRFYSSVFRSHFFTTSVTERDHLIANDSNWKYEGKAFSVSTEGEPVYRFYSRSYNSHFFTTSSGEKSRIMNEDENWQYEGIAWYVSKQSDATSDSPTRSPLPVDLDNDPVSGEHASVEEDPAPTEDPRESDGDHDGDPRPDGEDEQTDKTTTPPTEETVELDATETTVADTPNGTELDCDPYVYFRYYGDENDNNKYDDGEQYWDGVDFPSGETNYVLRLIAPPEGKGVERFEKDDAFNKVGAYNTVVWNSEFFTEEEGNAKRLLLNARFEITPECEVVYPNGQEVVIKPHLN